MNNCEQYLDLEAGAVLYVFSVSETVISVHSRGHSDWSGCMAWLKPPAGEGRLHCDIGLLDINQTTSTPWGIGIRGEEGEGLGGVGRGYNATWPLGLVARGQSNLMRLHWREKKRKIMMREGGRGETEEGKGSGKYYIILCIPPQDHGNSLIRTTSVPAVHWPGFSSLLKHNWRTGGKREICLDCPHVGFIHDMYTLTLGFAESYITRLHL